MNFSKAFTYVFEDPDWIKKIIIMGLIILIPILGQIVLVGWMVDIIRKIIRQEPVTLPSLAFGEQLSDGFKMVVISLVYAAPIILLSIIQGIISGVAGGMTSDGNMAEAGGALIAIVSLCFGLVYFLYGIVLAFVMPIVYGRYAEIGTIGSGLQFGEVINMAKKVVAPLLITIVGNIAASFVASLGSIACGIGVLATTAYAMAVMAHFYGQVYNLAKAQ
jgi:hypothetical protein